MLLRRPWNLEGMKDFFFKLLLDSAINSSFWPSCLVWYYFSPLHKLAQNSKQFPSLYRFPFIFKTVHCLIFHWQPFHYFSAVIQLQYDTRFGTWGLEHMIKAVFNLIIPAQNELWHLSRKTVWDRAIPKSFLMKPMSPLNWFGCL